MKAKYKKMTIPERVEVLKEYVKTGLAKDMVKILKKKAKGGKLIIDFSDKLSPKATSKFIDEDGVLVVGKHRIKLPPFKNEHCLCRVMFSRKLGEPVSWDLINEEMSGKELEIDSKNRRRTVQDAMYAINDRIKKYANTDDDFLSWKGKCIRRNF